VARVLFSTVGNVSEPIGGVKVIYQAVAALRRAGLEAHVATAAGRPPWLGRWAESDPEIVLDLDTPRPVGPEDIHVVPETLPLDMLPQVLRRPDRRVIFVQNHHHPARNRAIDWRLLRGVRCLTVSEVSRQALRETIGFERIEVIPPGVDLSVFRPAPEKRHRVAYMPRKWRGAVEQIRARLPASVEWLAIDGRGEAETAEMLAGSSVFLTLGREEGFGLPALEAMASGCVVCGFRSGGMADYATPENGIWVEEGDIDACAVAVGRAVTAVAGPERFARYVRAGLATARRLSVPVFEERMVRYFSALLESEPAPHS
jgi:glycosyltransferase involved in cell wall biosynthesis